MLSFLPCRLFLNEICKILVYVSIAKKFRESNKTNRRGIRPAYNWYCSSTDRSNTDTFFRAIHIRRTFLCWSHLRTNLYLHWQISKHLVVCLLSSYLAKWTELLYNSMHFTNPKQGILFNVPKVVDLFLSVSTQITLDNL